MLWLPDPQSIIQGDGNTGLMNVYLAYVRRWLHGGGCNHSIGSFIL